MNAPSRWKNHRVLVTGAGGFLGRTVCREFLAAEAIVYGTWRHRPVPHGVTALPMELLDPESWQQAFAAASPDLVIHLASPVQPERIPADPVALRDAIVGGTLRIAESCQQSETRLLVAGTCEEYGDGPAPFHEDTPAQPVSPYSTAKAEASELVLQRVRTQGLKATVARPFLTYGPGQEGARLVPSAIDAALSGQPFAMTDGGQTRELTFVEDMARALFDACGVEGQLLNLGSGDEHTVYSIVERIYRLCGASTSSIQVGALPRRSGETNRFVGDHTRARRLLSFRPRVPLDEGLMQTIESRRQRAANAG